MVDSIVSIPIVISYEQGSSDRVACIFLPINPITAHIEIPVQEVFMFSDTSDGSVIESVKSVHSEKDIKDHLKRFLSNEVLKS